MKRFAKKIEIATLPTPMHPAGRLSAKLGGPEIFLKRDDLTGLAISGNKIRKLEYCIAEALTLGAEILITCGGPQSNHARATAAAAAKVGLRCHLVLNGSPESIPDGNLFLDFLFGAKVSFVPAADLRELEMGMKEIADSYKVAGFKPYIIPLGASDALGSLGYVDAIGEIAEQAGKMGAIPDRIVFPCGSAGTLAGVVAGCLVHGLDCRVTGISVAFPSEWSSGKVAEIFHSLRERFIPELPEPEGKFEVIDDYIGDGYGKASQELISFIREAASLEAIILDPTYTGKGLFGLKKEIEKGNIEKGERVLFIHTGGAFGLFPYRERFVEEFKR